VGSLITSSASAMPSGGQFCFHRLLMQPLEALLGLGSQCRPQSSLDQFVDGLGGPSDEPFGHLGSAERPAQFREHRRVHPHRDVLAVDEHATAVENHQFNHRIDQPDKLSLFAPNRDAGGLRHHPKITNVDCPLTWMPRDQ
jgi:hypothetical protein